MKLLYKKIAMGVVVFVFIPAILILFTDRMSEEAETTEDDTVNTAAFAVYEEPAMAKVIPNNLIATTMGNINKPVYEASSYINKVVAYVDDYLPVRTEPDRSSETVGKMYSGCVADVLERGETWSKVSSGNVVGYIQNMYVCFDGEAEDLVILLGGEEELSQAVTIEEEEAMLAEEARRKAEEEAAAKASAEKAAAEKAAKEAAEKAAAEQAAREAAEKSVQESASQQEEQTAAPAQSTAEIQTEASVSPYYMELSEEDIHLIACIIDWESNSEVYEGKLAVANIILNRVRSSAYPDTVSGVIYQRGQFGGVLDSSGNLSSRWQARLASGPRNEECYQAARDAASGNNNVEGYLSFNGTAYCNLKSFKSYVIIGNHCFFQR